MADSEYRVETSDWPVNAREGDLTVDQVHDVLDKFDAHWPGAVDSLATAGEEERCQCPAPTRSEEQH